MFERRLHWLAASGPLLLGLALFVRWCFEPTWWAFGFVFSACLATATTLIVCNEMRRTQKVETDVPEPLPPQPTPDTSKHLLEQLRVQFEEKNEVLHKTRVELFHAESELLRLHRERELSRFAPSPYFAALQEPLEEAAKAQEEIAALEQLVAELLEELKRRSVPSLSGFQFQNQ